MRDKYQHSIFVQCSTYGCKEYGKVKKWSFRVGDDVKTFCRQCGQPLALSKQKKGKVMRKQIERLEEIHDELADILEATDSNEHAIDIQDAMESIEKAVELLVNAST